MHTIVTANRLKRPRRVPRSFPRPCIRPVHHESNRKGTTSIHFRTLISRTRTRTAQSSFTLHPSIYRVPSRRRRYYRWRGGTYRHRWIGGSQDRKFSSTLNLYMEEVDRLHSSRFQSQLRSAFVPPGQVFATDIALQPPPIQSRSRGGMSLAGMLNSPVQSMRPLPPTSMPAALSAPLLVQQSMSSAFIPPARESSYSGYAFDSTRASMSTGRDSISSSGPPRQRTESTSTVGPSPSGQNGPMSAGLYPPQPTVWQRTIPVGSPPPNLPQSQPYSYQPPSVGTRGAAHVLYPQSLSHPPPQQVHTEPAVAHQSPPVVRPRTAPSPIPLQAVPSPSYASVTPAPPPSLPSRLTSTRSPSMRPFDRRSVSQIPLEVKMEIVEGLPMGEDAEDQQVHTFSPAAFQVPPSSNSSVMVTPVMVDPPPKSFPVRHRGPSMPVQEVTQPVPAPTEPAYRPSPTPRQVSMALSVVSETPADTPDVITGPRQPSISPAQQQSVQPVSRQVSVTLKPCQDMVAPLPSPPAQEPIPGPQREKSLVPEPFVTASPAPVDRSPSLPSDPILPVPPLQGQTLELHIAELEQVVRSPSPVPAVLQHRQSLLEDIWRDTAVVVRPQSSSSSGMRPQMQPKRPTERPKVEIPEQDAKMISPASSSPLSSPPDEHDNQASSEVESDEESDEEGDCDEDESMTESNDEESSEDLPIRIRRGKRTTTVEFSDSSSPPRIPLAGTHTVRSNTLGSPKGDEVPVDDGHPSPSPPPPPKASTICTAPSIIPTSEHDNLMELDEQPQAGISSTADRPSTPQTLEPPKPPANTEPAPTPSTKTAEEAPTMVPRQSSPKAPPVRRIPYSEYRNRKREQGVQPKVVPLPETTGGSIAPLLGLAASTPVQTPTNTTSPLNGPYSSVLSTSTASAMSGLGAFMSGGSTTSIGEPTPVPLPKKDPLTCLPRPSARVPTPPSLIGASAMMPAPSSTLSLVNSGSSNQTSTDPRLRPLSPVALPTVSTKSNGHSSMTPTSIPIVSPVLPAPTVPLVRSNTTPMLRRTPPTGPKADRERRPPVSPRTAPAAQTPGRPPPKLPPSTPKEDGEIDPSRPSSPLAKPIPGRLSRGWEETPKQPRAFKRNGPNAAGSVSPASPAVSRDDLGSGPSRANSGWRGGRGGHPPTGPRALRENGTLRSNTVGGGYGPRGSHDRDWDPERDRDAGWRDRERRDRDRDREWGRERRRR